MAAVRSHGHQLRRSADDRLPQADAVDRVRLVRDGLCRHRLLVPGLLRRLLPDLRSGDGQDRGALGSGDRLPDLADRPHDARRRARPVALHHGPHAAGRRRGRRLPRRDQGRGRVVPQEGTRLRHRPVQRRHQYRRHRDASGRAYPGVELRLAGGLCRHRSAGPGLAADLADRLSPPA
ncbi:hypothetical protein D3C72_1353640 [compost metagenome]